MILPQALHDELWDDALWCVVGWRVVACGVGYCDLGRVLCCVVQGSVLCCDGLVWCRHGVVQVGGAMGTVPPTPGAMWHNTVK